MTRDEYLKRAEEVTGFFGLSNHMVFPRLLQSMAEFFFVYGEEKDKELAEETRRRLIQLNKTGVTDL